MAYLHVFSYSPRRGTLAAQFPDQVDASVKRSRSKRMRLLGQSKKERFRLRFIEKELEALVLNQPGPESGYKVALTGNYIPVFIEADKALVNHLVNVRVVRVTREGTWGKLTSILN